MCVRTRVRVCEREWGRGREMNRDREIAWLEWRTYCISGTSFLPRKCWPESCPSWSETWLAHSFLAAITDVISEDQFRSFSRHEQLFTRQSEFEWTRETVCVCVKACLCIYCSKENVLGSVMSQSFSGIRLGLQIKKHLLMYKLILSREVPDFWFVLAGTCEYWMLAG